MKRTILLYTLFLALMQGTVWSQIPKTMSYQGVLKDATGALVADGNYSITFNLYDVATGGTALWTETQSSVSVASGVFSVILGSATTLDLTFDKQYWLGVTVGTDTELSPRIKLTASPYSLNALSVAGSSNAFPSSGNVGIGTTSPSYKLDVAGNIGISSNSGSLRLPSNQGSGSSTLFNYSDGKNYIRGETKFDSGELVYVAGNVGIGTTSPAQKLEVAGNVQIGDTPIAVTTAAIQVNGDIHLGGANREILNAGNNSLAFGVNNTVKMTIASTGNVGIGTADPDYLFHVMGGNKFIAATTTDFVVASAGSFIGMRPGANTGDTYSEIRALTGGAGTWGDLVLQSGGGKVGIGTTSPNTQLELYKSVSAGVGSAIRLTNPNTDDGTAGELEFYTDQSTGKISFIRTGVSGAPADISFSTHKSDAAGVVEHMRIKNTGNVGIGTTNPENAKLQVNGELDIFNGTASILDFKDSDPTNYDGRIRYLHSNREMQFYTAQSQRMVLNSSGNVGIGTTSISSPAGWGKLVEISNTGATNGAALKLTSNSTNWEIGAGGTGASNPGALFFGDAGAANVVFDDNGNVGIGTTSPNTAGVTSANTVVTIRSPGTTGNGVIELQTPNPTGGDNMGRIFFQDLDGGSTAVNSAAIYGTLNSASTGCLLRFLTGTGATGGTERMRITEGGNVGIGTTSPSGSLEVKRTSGDSYVYITATGGGYDGGLFIESPDDRYPLLRLKSGSEYWDIRQRAENTDALRFSTESGTSVLELTRAGNVGIGTTAPSEELHVKGTGEIQGILESSDSNAALKLQPTGTSNSWRISAQRSTASNAADALTFYDDTADAFRMVIEKSGNVGIGTTSPSYKLDVNGNVAFGTSDSYSTLDLRDGANASWRLNTTGYKLRFMNDNGGTFSEKMVIENSGDVGIGTTAPDNILTIVQGSSTDPIADAWTQWSSRRWKTNIEPLEGALEKVQALRGVSFDWKTDGKHDIGLIAEEVGEVIPEVVAYEKNGEDAKSVDYARLVAVLIEAVKEQQNVIDELAERLAVIEERTQLTSR